MNYYFWKDIDGCAGNVYAKNEQQAKQKAEEQFRTKVAKVELLEKDVRKNRFTGKSF